MSASSLPRRPRKLGPRRTIAIVGSLYNEDLVDSLVDSVNEELKRLMPSVSVPAYRVPGAFEIPVCVRHVIDKTRVDAVIALGVIVRGETSHADLVGNSVTDALQNIAVDTQVPVIHEVLLVDDRQTAEARCNGEKNRGVEAARAAVTMAELFGKLKMAASEPPPRKTAGVNG